MRQHQHKDLTESGNQSPLSVEAGCQQLERSPRRWALPCTFALATTDKVPRESHDTSWHWFWRESKITSVGMQAEGNKSPVGSINVQYPKWEKKLYFQLLWALREKQRIHQKGTENVSFCLRGPSTPPLLRVILFSGRARLRTPGSAMSWCTPPNPTPMLFWTFALKACTGWKWRRSVASHTYPKLNRVYMLK